MSEGFGGGSRGRRRREAVWERRPTLARLGELRGGELWWRLPRAVKIALFSELVIAMVVVLMATGGGGLGVPQVVLAPLAADQQDDDPGGDQGGGDQGDGDQGGGDQGDGSDEAQDEDEDSDGQQGGGNGDEQDGSQQEDGEDAGEGDAAGEGDDGGEADADEEFAGRDEIGRASADEYVPINQVESNSGLGEGGDFSGGSYTIQCTLSDHTNSDNPILAPGVRNGAQHVHEYAGATTANAESDEESLREGGTTCTNGDQSPIFWPVLRNVNGTGPDVGQDGGSLDGNVGSYVSPSEIDITFRGHGSEQVEPMPLNMVLVTGNAKAATQDGEGANAKYACSGAPARVTDQYPICPAGDQLQRVYDFPSCWPGEATDSEDSISHINYPDEQGECADDEIPVPAARVTLSYDQSLGRSFAIDAFPEQQHDPITDHAFLEYLSSERRSATGAACINANRRCVQGSAENAAFSTARQDQVPASVGFGRAMGNMMRTGFSPRDSAAARPAAPSPTSQGGGGGRG